MRVVVTGAAQGIGEAVSRSLAASGHRVFLADIQSTKVASVADSIGMECCTVDISSDRAVQAMYEKVTASWSTSPN